MSDSSLGATTLAEFVGLTQQFGWFNRHDFLAVYWGENKSSGDRLWVRTLRRLQRTGVPHKIRETHTKRNGTKMKEVMMLIGPEEVERWNALSLSKGQTGSKKEALRMNATARPRVLGKFASTTKP